MILMRNCNIVSRWMEDYIFKIISTMTLTTHGFLVKVRVDRATFEIQHLNRFSMQIEFTKETYLYEGPWIPHMLHRVQKCWYFFRSKRIEFWIRFQSWIFSFRFFLFHRFGCKLIGYWIRRCIRCWSCFIVLFFDWLYILIDEISMKILI